MAEHELSWDAVLAWRMARHGVGRGARAGAEDWLAVVRRISGLHAQVMSSAELTLWARVEDLDAAVVPRKLWDERALVKTWAMRGTLHLLAANELALYAGAQGVLKPRYEQASWRKAFGMSSDEAVAVLDAIRDALADEPLTRDELGDAVAAALGDARLGDAVRGSFGTMPKLAAFRGDVVFAPSAGQRVRFTRPDRWLDTGWKPAAPKEAMEWVLRRHLALQGPVTRERFARWFGMASAAQAGRLLKSLGDEVVAVVVGGEEGWMLSGDVDGAAACAPAGAVALLPAFDQYVVGAPRADSPVLAADLRDRVYRPQGWLSPVVVVDGRIEGVWRHERKGRRLSVTVEPFGDLGEEVRAACEGEARRLAAFLGCDEPEVEWE